jgi:hypothetical protein
MLRTIGDIIGAVLVRNGVTTSATGTYTDTVLNGWINDAHRFAAAAHKWPFTEGRVSTTFVTEETPLFEGWRSDGIRYLTIGGHSYQKTRFNDYMKFREDSPDDDDRIFTDFGRTLYVNPNGASGTMVAYGQYVPAKLDTTDPTLTTVFSDNDEEGNEAIVEEMLSYAAQRERKPDIATFHHQRAIAIINDLYARIGGEQFGYLPKDSEMFERIDIVNGGYRSDTFKRDQFN